MAITLERIIDKILDQWPLYAGIGITGYVAWKLAEGLQSKKKGDSGDGARIGKVGGGGGGYEGGGV